MSDGYHTGGFMLGLPLGVPAEVAGSVVRHQPVDDLIFPRELGKPRYLKIESCQAEPQVVDCLTTVRCLAGAASLQLLEFEKSADMFRCLAESRIAEKPDRMSAELASEVISEMAGSTAKPSLAWIGDDGSSLLLKLDALAEKGKWLLFTFEQPNRALHGRVDKSAPQYGAVVRSVLDLVAERGRLQARERAMATVLDSHDCGIVVLRQDQTILFKNIAAASVLRDGVIVETRNGSLRPTAYHDAVRFQTALDCVIVDGQLASPKRTTGMIMLLKGRDDLARPVVAVITPAGDRHGETAVAGLADMDAAAVLYFVCADQGTSRGLEPICQLHGLSPVESRLVTHLVAGLTISDSAAAMRIKPDTARAYLKQVFAKVGIHRQSSLVSIFTRYQRAVRGDFDFQVA